MKRMILCLFVLCRMALVFSMTEEEKRQLLDRAREYHDRYMFEDAMCCVERAATAYPDDIYVRYNRAVICLEMCDPVPALRDLDFLLQKTPEAYVIWYLYGCAQFALKNYETAIEDETRSLGLNPKADEAFDMRGSAYFSLGLLEEAIADYDRAISCGLPAGSDLHKTYTNRALAYLELGRYDNVVEDCTNARSFNPNYVTLYVTRADAYVKLGRYMEALADCAEAIRLSPADGYHARGTVYWRMEKYREAADDFTSAIRCDDANPDYYSLRGIMYMNLNKDKSALRDFNRAIELAPADAVYYKYRGGFYLKHGQREKALRDLDYSLSLDPSDEQALRFKGEAEVLSE